jgi:hypothetical protein
MEKIALAGANQTLMDAAFLKHSIDALSLLVSICAIEIGLMKNSKKIVRFLLNTSKYFI